MGVQPREPIGSSWDYGIGGGWDHITIRANSVESSHHPIHIAPDNTPVKLPNQDGTVGDNSRSGLMVNEQQQLNGSVNLRLILFLTVWCQSLNSYRLISNVGDKRKI
ncbi:hypothetical protein scyTo_0007541 [Scyliorhinus torazame]|uniref:Uncharacterized protein n=1 Tax=Scyliorhinus torazame TaxID=75743 RepID=A0A401NUG6_SCYTO|nr:hypothetical protein [Scyliorhinus torazame]